MFRHRTPQRVRIAAVRLAVGVRVGALGVRPAFELDQVRQTVAVGIDGRLAPGLGAC